MSRAPRRRRRAPEDTSAAPPLDREPVSARDRVDPRAIIDAPLDVLDDPERLLAWVKLNAPGSLKSEGQVHAEREHLERSRRFREARSAARRRGLPAPEPADSIPGFAPA